MITKDDLQYLGAVRTPAESFHYGGAPASVDLARRQYVMTTRGYQVARTTMVRPQIPQVRLVPDVINGVTITRRLLDLPSVPISPLVDGAFIDPANGTWNELALDNAAVGPAPAEVVVFGDKVLVAGSIYFDAGGTQDVSWFVADWPLTVPVKRTPWKSIAGLPEGWAAGPMTSIPLRYRALLGGDVLFGQPGGLPIITRQSFGPCAIVATANDFLTAADVPAKLLLGYGQGDLALWGQGSNDYWNSCTQYNAITFVGHYLLFIGNHGYGEAKYGEGTADRALDGTINPVDGGLWVYDPVIANKGTHAYPYRVQAVGYLVTDLGEVAAGRKKASEITPAFWVPLEFPSFDHPVYGVVGDGITPLINVNGADYDSEACELHVSVFAQDSVGYEPGPLWHVFKVKGMLPEPNTLLRLGDNVPLPAPIPEPIPTPVPEPPPPPPSTDPCESMKLELASVQSALAAEQQIHSNDLALLSTARTKLSSINAEATTILAHNATLKPNAKIPKWATDALQRIVNLSR
jgi:hypothetical protein